MAAEYLERMGERIRQRREEFGLTQEELARQMPGRVTGARISLWERGKNRPRDDSLESLAKVLKVDVAYFMADEPDKTRTPDLFAVDGDGEKSTETAVRDLLREQSRILREIKATQKEITDALEALPAVANGLTALLQALEAERRPGRRAGGEG